MLGEGSGAGVRTPHPHSRSAWGTVLGRACPKGAMGLSAPRRSENRPRGGTASPGPARLPLERFPPGRRQEGSRPRARCTGSPHYKYTFNGSPANFVFLPEAGRLLPATAADCKP